MKDLLENLLILALSLSTAAELVQVLAYFLSSISPMFTIWPLHVLLLSPSTDWSEEAFKAHPARSDDGSLEVREEALPRSSSSSSHLFPDLCFTSVLPS